MPIDLTGKLALVTGAGKGIGKAIALSLAAGGAKVAVHYLNSSAGAERTVQEIRQVGGEAIAFQADLSRCEQAARLFADIHAAFGDTVDILVNNAGHLVERRSNADMTEDVYNRIMDINLKSTVFVSREAIPGMKTRRYGKIVNMTSLAAHNGGGPGATIYAASKAAVLTFTKGLAKELAPYRINVNAVSPGFIGQTDFHATFTSEEARRNTINGIPLGREGVPKDVAEAVLFLVSDMSSYLTGETIEINGGMFMR